MDDLDEFTRWQDRTDGRLATMETVSREHTGEIAEHGTVLVSIKDDLKNLKAGFKDLRADFGVQKTLIQAVHDVQSDYSARLVRVENGLTEVKADVATIKGDVAKLKRDMSETKVGVHTIIALLNREIGDKTE